jgi:hypothetical protein
METISVDWSEELKDCEKWENHGRSIAEENCKHKDQDNGNETNMRYSGYCDKCGFGEDSCQPMMNYAYPLRYLPDEDKILKIVKDTCLTVMENTETEEYYLALCGGGMDLSQSIALAYLIAENRIPYSLCLEVCTQPCLSVGKKEYFKIMRAVKQELKHNRWECLRRYKEITETVKSYRAKQKLKVVS